MRRIYKARRDYACCECGGQIEKMLLYSVIGTRQGGGAVVVLRSQ